MFFVSSCWVNLEKVITISKVESVFPGGKDSMLCRKRSTYYDLHKTL